MTREYVVEMIKAIKNGLHETGKDFPYRDEIIPIAKEALEVAIKALEQEPKSEWQHDHEILKAHSDGANDVLDKIRAEIEQLDYNLESVDYDHNDMAMTEDVHMICQEEVLQIIDKYKVNKHEPKPNIKALGEDMRICQKSITDEKVLIGFNMAVAICNKHLAERGDK